MDDDLSDDLNDDLVGDRDDDDDGQTASAASLSAAVLAEEAARHAEGQADPVLFPDDLLPGVKSEGISLRKGLAMGGGAATFVVLMVLNSLACASGCHSRAGGSAFPFSRRFLAHLWGDT